MKTLEQIRNEIAVKYGAKDWSDYLLFMIRLKTTSARMTVVFDEIAEAYHAQFAEQKAISLSDSPYPDGHDPNWMRVFKLDITEQSSVVEKMTAEKKTTKHYPCPTCGSTEIIFGDCGYSSFNIAYAECKKCGHKLQFNCSCFIEQRAIIDYWNNHIVHAQQSTVTNEYIRKVALSFWFYWYNHPGGTNTEEAFDKWWTENKGLIK